MLDLFNSPQELASLAWYSIPVMVFVASLLGSSHCVGMCGGISMALPQNKLSLSLYHLGRLLGYLSLGAIAGMSGSLLLNHHWLSLASAGMMSGLFLLTAFNIWQGKSMHLPLPKALTQLLNIPLGHSLSASRKYAGMGLAVGILTVLLPCGWLYTFVLGAVATQNIWSGALFLFFFWLGTVPLLSIGPVAIQAWLKKRPAQKKWIATLFLMAGLVTIGQKLMIPAVDAQDLKKGGLPACHQRH